MARQILAWQCKFCGDVKKSKTIADRHEITCLSNPDAKNCVLCKYSRTPTITFGDEDRRMFCSVRQINCSRAVSAKCDSFEVDKK